MDILTNITFLVIALNAIISYKGFKDFTFFEKHAFRVDEVLIGGEYHRLLSSGFLHVNWSHLIFNMISLYFFSDVISYYLGWVNFLIIYIASLIGGNLLSLFIHRNHGDYSAVGASGAVSGIIFSSIALFPGMGVGMMFLPVMLPGWLFGLIFVLGSIYGIRSNKSNIGHDAHLGGALVGMLAAIALKPLALQYDLETILVILIPGILFIIAIIKFPRILLIDNLFFKNHQNLTKDQRYNAEKVQKEKELDRLLEKIHSQGFDSLTKREREALERLSS